MIKRCEVCEAEFAARPRKMFCSATCQSKKAGERRAARFRFGRTCTQCQTSISHLHGAKKFCSDECRHSHNAAEARRRRRENHEAYCETERARYQRNREKYLAQDRARRERNREKIAERRRKLYALDPSKAKAAAAARYWKDPDAARERAREERQRNLGKRLEYDRKRAKEPKRREAARKRNAERSAAIKLFRQLESQGLEALL